MITTWLQHKWADRKEHAHALLKKLRLGLVSTESLEKLRERKELEELTDCKMLIDEVLSLKITKTTGWLTETPLFISHPEVFSKRTTNQVSYVFKLCCVELLPNTNKVGQKWLDYFKTQWKFHKLYYTLYIQSLRNWRYVKVD